MLTIGLMSGTSADGVTAALTRFEGRHVFVLNHLTFPYPAELRERVLSAPMLATPELSRLHQELGGIFAQAALKVLRGARGVTVIGSHGQTVWHGPEESPPNTLQLAEPAIIAERTGLPVVADFRPRDMAAGGQGAPLIAAFDEYFFSSGPLKALQNIGGIANVTVAGGGRCEAAFDNGPGNCLMDLAVRLATMGRRGFDKDGALAARGKPDERIQKRLLNDPYFRRKPPKSLERSRFSESHLRKHFGPISPRSTRKLPDILATLSLFTARAIAESYRRFILPRGTLTQAVISGGGALNKTLMRDLTAALHPIPLTTSELYGLPVQAKEAACFAWLALRAWQGKTNNCPAATGSRGRRILGKITPA